MGAFLKSFLRCFFGELGAKPFFLVVLLTAWVATWEARRLAKESRRKQLQAMVLAGALAGLLLHSILVAFHASGFPGTPAWNFTGAAILVLLGLKVHFEFRAAQARAGFNSDDEAMAATKKNEDEVFNPLAATVPASSGTTWNNFAFRSQPVAATANEGYGSTPAPTSTASKEPLKPIEEDALPLRTMLTVGFMSMALIFVVEVGDISQLPGEKDFVLMFSSMLGYILATCIAVLIGYFLESVLHPDVWVLLVAELGFFAMALACFSQAMMGLNSLSVERVTAALLSFTSR